MQAVRTVIWVLLLVALGIFSFANWTPVAVRIWDGLVLDTMLPAVIILAFGIGFVPMWLYHRAAKWQLDRKIELYHRAAKWQLDRKIAALEQAARSIAPAPAPPPPVSPEPAVAPQPVAEPIPLAPEVKAPDA